MKKIFESEMNSWSIDYAERIHVYAIDDENEHQQLDNMNYAELCEYFGVPREPAIGMLPGARWSSYSFRLFDTHIVVSEHISYNV